MSCRWCVHWHHAGKYKSESETGECRRYPASVKTNKLYSCGEFLAEKSIGYDGCLIESFRDGMVREREWHHEEREKRIALQKKNKELRAKLREKAGKS